MPGSPPPLATAERSRPAPFQPPVWLPCLLLLVGLLIARPSAAWSSLPQHYSCGGDPLLARVETRFDLFGELDPLPASGPPDSLVVLQWRNLTLQLPRSQDPGPASYTNGTWTWDGTDSRHPRLSLLREERQDFPCTRTGTANLRAVRRAWDRAHRMI